MVFFNSITKGEKLLGIPLHFHSGENGENIEKTIEGLIEKGILKSNTELSEEGFLPAYALECYKNANNHVMIESSAYWSVNGRGYCSNHTLEKQGV